MNSKFSWRKVNLFRKLYTKGFCFFCLRKTQNIPNKNNEQTKIDNNSILDASGNGNTMMSLVCLRRHLQINLNEVTGYATSNILVPSVEEVKVNLCDVCEKVVERFSVLFQQCEKLQMEIDFYLKRNHQRIREGSESPELLQNYSNGMSSNVQTLSELAWIDSFRKEISFKCSQIRLASYQTVQAKNKTFFDPCIIKEEIVDDIDFTPPKVTVPTNPDPVSTSNDSLPIIASIVDVKIDGDGKNTAGVEIAASNIQSRKNDCSKTYERHSRTKKPRKYLKYICTTCGRKFHLHSLLERHQKDLHVKPRAFVCVLCSRRFKCLSNLTWHNKLIHSSEETWRFKPTSKKYSLLRSLKKPDKSCEQKAAANNEEKIQKESEEIRRQDRLIQQRSFSGNRNECKFCHKAFPFQRRSLWDHIKRCHEDTVSVKCDVVGCSYVFNGSTRDLKNLNRHKINRCPKKTGPHLCPDCKKGFTRKSSLNVHINKSVCKKKLKSAMASNRTQTL